MKPESGCEQQSEKGNQKKEEGPSRVYRGNCHCGRFVFEAELPEIKSAMKCNCSICHKKGYLWVFPAEGSKFEIVKGTKDTLAQYTFGKKSLAHKFCSTCATPVMGEFIGGNGRAFNVRAIQGIDPWALEKQPFDGATLGDNYAPPEHKGPVPPHLDHHHKPITGSCHCGAVTVAFMSKPMDDDETGDDDIAECNCSICMRNAYRWIYPKKERIVLYARVPSNIGRYSFGRHVVNKTFCKICGVCMTNEYNNNQREASSSISAALPGGGGEFAERLKAMHPVNLRIFPNLDWTKMKAPELIDGANKIAPPYENP